MRPYWPERFRKWWQRAVAGQAFDGSRLHDLLLELCHGLRGSRGVALTVARGWGWQAGSELIIEDRGERVVVRWAGGIPETYLDQLIGCTGYAGPRRSLAELEGAIAPGARKTR